MAGRTIAIGDIHGCSVPLRALLAAIDPGEQDTLVTLGDYVDRGPDSRGVLDLLVGLLDRCQLIPLLGNHELMLLQSLQDKETFEFWKACGGAATLTSYQGRLENIPFEHLVFLRGLRLFHETEKHLFVHACYDELSPLRDTPDEILLWEHVSAHPPGPHCSGKVAVVGHTPQGDGEVLDLGHLLCIDTYCFGGGWLTAIDVDSRQTWQADLQGRLRNA